MLSKSIVGRLLDNRKLRHGICIVMAMALVAVLPRVALGSAPAPSVWTAQWIDTPGITGKEYGVYHFRRSFELTARPASFVVHVSADNRYELYANGKRLTWGPARGDVRHWQYDTVDIAPYLQPGRNVLAAIVWNFGDYSSVAQMSKQTGFLLQGDGPAERLVDTSRAWRTIASTAWAPRGRPRAFVNTGERIDGSQHLWNWQLPSYEDQSWLSARELQPAATAETPDQNNGWLLVPRRVPPMAETPGRLARVRRTEGQMNGMEVPSAFPAQSAPFTVPAGRKVVLLMDNDVLTTAFPELVVSGGRGSTVELRYAEALHAPGRPEQKGNRDEVVGKVTDDEMHADLFLLDGGRGRIYRPLFWRTFRFIELTIETKDHPLTVVDVRSVATSYPFVRRARFDVDALELQSIREVGWRTASLCAHETYMDCPYYEQLQYVGDTRIQALVSLYETGDSRLMRQALQALDESRIAEGLTFSRYPSARAHFIPPFSLLWIEMLRDWWWYVDDVQFVRDRLPGLRGIVGFFQRHQLEDGRLGRLPFWNFVDWAASWAGGVPPGSNRVPSWSPASRPEVAKDDPLSTSSAIDLQFLLALQAAAEIENAVGNPALARENKALAEKLSRSIRRAYWEPAHRLFADTPTHSSFSQQSNALAILAGVLPQAEAKSLAERLIHDSSLTKASIYFRHYVATALIHAGLGEHYLEGLGDWRTMLKQGLTTWAETSDPSRSDCHAWGSSPNIELLRTVIGIDSGAPGFSKILIRPHLQGLERVSGAVPHPRGEVAASFVRSKAGVAAELQIPSGTTGELRWRGRRHQLKPGMTTRILLKP